MKKIISLILVFILAFAFCACGDPKTDPQPAAPQPDPAATEPVPAVPEAAPAAPAANDPAPAAAPEPSAPEAPAADDGKHLADILFETVDFPEKASWKAIITGVSEDGSPRWTYETETVYVSELDNIQEIGFAECGYLFIVSGTVFCLGTDEENEGKILWQNDEFGGASAAWDFDDEGNLYICGYYGPDIMIIGPDGETVLPATNYSYSEDFYWPCYIDARDDGSEITIGYDSNGEFYYVDPEYGDVIGMSCLNTIFGPGMFMVGTWGNDPVDPDFTIVFEGSGYYFATREDPKYGTCTYTGTWNLLYEDDDHFKDADVLILPVSSCDDPKLEHLDELGEYRVSIGTDTEDFTLELYQLNEGDSLFYTIYDDVCPTLFKLSDDSAMG